MRTFRLILIGAASLVLAAHASFAKTVTWTGEDGAAWNAEGSWSETPTSGDKAIIPAGVTLKAVSTDKATFDLFGAFEIRKGAELLVWQYAQAIPQTLTGSGKLVLVGVKDKKTSSSISGDNRDFTGTFHTTNMATSVKSQYALGTTNAVYVWGSGSDMYSQQMSFPSGSSGAPDVTSNEFHLCSDSYVSLFYNGRNPLTMYGPVYGEGWVPAIYPGAATAYEVKLYGGLHGKVLAALGANADYYLIELRGGTVDIGQLVARAGGFLIATPIDGTTLQAGREGCGFKFEGANVACTNAPWVFNQNSGYDTGGHFDLNGYDQEIGDLIVHSTGAASYPKAIIRSTVNPATLTVRGSMGRKYGQYNKFPGVLKGRLSFVYDYDGRVGPTVTLGTSSWTNPAGKFMFSDSESDTTGSIGCKKGELTILDTASMPNVTGLIAQNEGQIIVNSANVGTAGNLDVVKSEDSAVLTIAANITISTRTAKVGAKWLEPGDYVGATAGLPNLAGAGTLHVAEYGGRKGLVISLQ